MGTKCPGGGGPSQGGGGPSAPGGGGPSAPGGGGPSAPGPGRYISEQGRRMVPVQELDDVGSAEDLQNRLN